MDTTRTTLCILTYLLATALAAAQGPFTPTVLGEVNNTLIVAGIDESGDVEPWRYFRGRSGERLGDLNPDGPSSPRQAFQVGGYLVFLADVSATQTGLFATDGVSLIGPKAVWARSELPAPTGDAWGVAAGSRAFFAAPARDSAANPLGLEPHYWDVPDGAVTLVKDARPGPEGSDPRDFVLYRNNPHFSADDGVHGRELWWIGAQTLECVFRDILPGAGGSDPDKLAAIGDFVFCNATLPEAGRRLIRFSSEAQDTSPPATCRPWGHRHIAYYTVDNGGQTELWNAVTTGSAVQPITGNLLPVLPGGRAFFAVGQKTFYIAGDSSNQEIVPVGGYAIFSTGYPERIRGVIEAGWGRFYIVVSDGSSEHLVQSDGTAFGARGVPGTTLGSPPYPCTPVGIGNRAVCGFDDRMRSMYQWCLGMAREIGQACSPRKRRPRLLTTPVTGTHQYIRIEGISPGDLVCVFFSTLDYTSVSWTLTGCADYVDMTGSPHVILTATNYYAITTPALPLLSGGRSIRVQARIVGVDGSESTTNAVSIEQ